MVRLLTGQPPQGDPQYFLASLDPGKGKTEAVCAFLRAWKSLGFHPKGSVLIGLSRLDEIRAYIDRSGLAEEDFAVLVANGDILNDRGLQDRSQAQILFTTHEKLFRWTQVHPFAAQACFHYQGNPRTLRIWDESLLPARPVTLRLDAARGLLEPLRPACRPTASLLDALFAEVSGKASGEAVVIPSALAAQPKVLSAALPAAHQDRWDQLTALAGRTAIIQDSNLYGRELVAASQPLPADFAPAIILDASGRVRQTYRVWERHGGNLVRLPEAANDYGRLTIHHWHRAASRDALKNPTSRQAILQAVAEIINGKDEHEPWLIIHHMPKGTINAPEELSSLIDNPNGRIHFLHWGNHHGTNAYRAIRNVIVLGLWHYPSATYAAQHLAASLGPAAPTITDADLDAMQAGEHQHNLLQAICRANVRNSSDGICGDCTVHVIGKAGKDTKALLADTFPGASIHDWQPVEPELTGRSLEVAQEIERRFSDPEITSVRKAEVRQAVGFTNSQDLAQVLRRPDFVGWLAGQGFGLGLREIVRATIPYP